MTLSEKAIEAFRNEESSNVCFILRDSTIVRMRVHTDIGKIIDRHDPVPCFLATEGAIRFRYEQTSKSAFISYVQKPLACQLDVLVVEIFNSDMSHLGGGTFHGWREMRNYILNREV